MAEAETTDNRQPTPDIAVRYVGEGKFLPGIPARDLSVDEWAALSDEVRGVCLSEGMYAPVGGERLASFAAPIDAALGIRAGEPAQGNIDLSDGANDAEAALAGKTLRKRRK